MFLHSSVARTEEEPVEDQAVSVKDTSRPTGCRAKLLQDWIDLAATTSQVLAETWPDCELFKELSSNIEQGYERAAQADKLIRTWYEHTSDEITRLLRENRFRDAFDTYNKRENAQIDICKTLGQTIDFHMLEKDEKFDEFRIDISALCINATLYIELSENVLGLVLPIVQNVSETGEQINMASIQEKILSMGSEMQAEDIQCIFGALPKILAQLCEEDHQEMKQHIGEDQVNMITEAFLPNS